MITVAASARTLFVTLGLLLPAGCHTSSWDPMKRQKKYGPYQTNPLFPDDRAMRPLVEGTICREQPVGETVARTGRTGDTWATSIPIPVDARLLDEGEKHFRITCAACHGLAGDGQSVVAAKMALRPPPSLVTPPIAAYPPGRVFEVASLGYGLMPSYASELSITERWAVVAYWQVLRLSQDAPLDAAPPEERARLIRESP